MREMPLFLHWGWAVVCHWVSLIGGAAVSVAMLVWAQYAPADSARLPAMIWWVGIAGGFIGACYLAWKEERERAERLDTGAEARWNRAIETYRGLLAINQPIIAMFSEQSDGVLRWSLMGASTPHVRALDRANRIAAAALGRSKVAASVPPEILEVPDLADRWLAFVAHEDGFNGPYGSAVDNASGLSSVTHSIRNVAEVSKRLCEHCRDLELCL